MKKALVQVTFKGDEVDCLDLAQEMGGFRTKSALIRFLVNEYSKEYWRARKGGVKNDN